jgi:hypothetical protein
MNAVRTIEVPVSFTVPELYRATLSIQYGKIPIAKRILFLVSLAFLGGLIWKLLGASQNEVIAAYAFIVGWILFPAFLVGVIFVAPYIGTAARVKREPRILGPAEYRFSEKSVEVSGYFGRSEILWTAFPEILETKEFFFLYVQGSLGHALPTRCFSSKAETVEFRELLRNVYRGKLKLFA